MRKNLEHVFALFPVLRERMGQAAGTLSGGEQQMLAIGRCLMGAPDLVMFDEPSLGLAPAVVQNVLRTIRDLNREGLTCVLVEQNVAVSLKLAAQAYVLENGRIMLSGAGETAAGRRSRPAGLSRHVVDSRAAWRRGFGVRAGHSRYAIHLAGPVFFRCVLVIPLAATQVHPTDERGDPEGQDQNQHQSRDAHSDAPILDSSPMLL